MYLFVYLFQMFGLFEMFDWLNRFVVAMMMMMMMMLVMAMVTNFTMGDKYMPNGNKSNPEKEEEHQVIEKIFFKKKVDRRIKMEKKGKRSFVFLSSYSCTCTVSIFFI